MLLCVKFINHNLKANLEAKHYKIKTPRYVGVPSLSISSVTPEPSRVLLNEKIYVLISEIGESKRFVVFECTPN